MMTGEPHDLDALMTLIRDEIRAELRLELEQHVADAHAHDMRVEAIIDMLVGKKDPVSDERHDEEGIVHMVRELYDRSKNGGVPAKLVSPARLEGKDRAYLLGAVVTGLSAVVVALLG